MRYSLLSYLACPHCRAPLVCCTDAEVEAVFPEGLFPPGARVNAGRGVGPTPPWRRTSVLTALLDRLATAAGSDRALRVAVQSGLLICGGCERWFPIAGGIPELLPDHLRDADREAALFAAVTSNAPRELVDILSRFRPSGDASTDPGAHHKTAEISIKEKVDDPAFFGPGYSAPFNPWAPDFTSYLITLFGSVLPLLELKRGDVVVDSGCGYAWTTEWLFRSGFDAVGVDICRTYLEIAVARMGVFRPHLVVCDVEQLPLTDAAADAVLAYESFHHIPDRRRAMEGYDRVLKAGGRIVLAEPGASHESAQVSVDAMEKYGILEKGMELADVASYAENSRFATPEQLYVVRTSDGDLGTTLTPPFLRRHSLHAGNLFRIRKPHETGHVRRAATIAARRALGPRLAHQVGARVRAVLKSFGRADA